MSDGSVTIEVTLTKDQLEKGLKGLKSTIDSSLPSASKTLSTFASGFEGLGKAFTKAGKLCVGATAGIVAGLSSAIGRFDTLKNYPKVLENLGFSAEDAKKSINTLSDGIDGLPTALDDAAAGVQRLVAKNSDIDKSTKYFLAMNDAIVAGNAPAEMQKTAIEQLTQAYSKGKPDLMEWRTLMMAMPGQLKQVATAMGYVDTDALYDALKHGKISMDDFMDKIVELDQKGAPGIKSFHDQAVSSCDSIGTAITNMGNRFKKGFATILESMDEAMKDTAFGSVAGVINNISTAIKNFLDKIGDTIKKNQAFKDLVNKISTGLKKMQSSIDNLSPTTLNKIVTAIVKIVEFGPKLLVLGKSFSILGSMIKGLSSVVGVIETVSTSLKVFKGTAEASTTGVKLLSSAMSFLTSPAGIAITAITALTAVVVAANREINKNIIQEKERTEEITKQKNALEELKQQQQENLNANLSEIDNVKRLKDELSSLVDENGKVKEGYKGRVSFILSELNNALGTEYKMTGNVIDNYRGLCDSIDETINKKKANIILSSQEEAYSNAIRNEAEAKKKLGEIQADLNKKIRERNKVENEYAEKRKNNDFGPYEAAALTAKKERLNEEVSAIQTSYDEQKGILQTYYQDIATYETNAALVQQGTAESIKQVNDSVMYSYQNRKDQSIQALTEQLNIEVAALNTYKETYATNQSEVTQAQMTESQNRLNGLIQELVNSTSVINENSPEVVQAWSDLATGSYDTYFDTVSNLPPDLAQKIQEMTGVTAQKTPELVGATEKMANQVVDQIEKSPEFKQEAINNLQGMLNGLEDGQLREFLKTAGVDNVDEVMKGIREGNLAEDEGMKILDSLKSGLNNTSWQNSLFSVARGIASTLSGLLTVKANVNGNVSALPGHKSGLDYVPRDNYVARLHKGERVLTKEENRDYTEAIKLSKKHNFDKEYKTILNQMQKNLDLNAMYNKMKSAVDFETAKLSTNLTTNAVLKAGRDTGKTTNNDNSTVINNTQNFYEKNATPYEEQKKAKQQLRRLVYGL